MNNNFKIRLLLFLLILGFAGTALTIRFTYQEQEILQIDGKKVQDNLHKKEALVREFLNAGTNFEDLANISENGDLKTYVINDLANENGIYVYTYANSDLIFWGSEQIVPRSDAGIVEGSSIITWKNGWYQAYKKSSSGFSVVCLIPIKSNYTIVNRFLKNDFSKDLIETPNLEVANYNDRSVFNLRNIDGEYLLSLKLRDTKFNTFYSVLELVMWIFAGLTATILVNVLCFSLAKRGWVKLSILFFAVFLGVFRYLDLKTHWIATNFYSGFFEPRVYASSESLPSLGALTLHILAALWLVCYIYHCRFELNFLKPTSARIIKFLVFFGLASFLYYLCALSAKVFESLVSDSSISFEFNDLLTLSFYSWVGIGLLCVVLLILYLLIEILLVINSSLELTKKSQVLFFSLTVVLLLILKIWTGDLTISFFLFIMIVYLKGWYSETSNKFNLAVFVAILFLLAGISSLKLNSFQEEKLQDNQVLALQRLESSEDPNAVLLFLDIEKQITNDKDLINYFESPDLNNKLLIGEQLKNVYFSGYLSKYDFNGYIVESNASNQDQAASVKLAYYKDQVIAGARKVSRNFYRISNNIGYVNYFGLLPVVLNDELVGTYVVELKNRTLGRYASYPEILFNGTVKNTDDFDKYSFAYYKSGVLKSQHGSFLYPVNPFFYPQSLRQYNKYNDKKGFSHILVSPAKDELLILSRKAESGWRQLATLSFLFLVFLIFSILLYSVQWVVSILNDYDFNFRNFRWSVMIFQNRVLYSTRIQAFVVLAVVGTLVIAGIITFFSLTDQYRIQQENTAIKQISQIARGLENRLSTTNMLEASREEDFKWSSEINTSDLNMYNLEGELIYTTQQKIYDLGLISKYMNANAWLNLHDFSRVEYIQRETIGELDFLVAYTPLKNEKNETIAFLSLPYFSTQRDLDEKVGLLLNTIINVYALVLVALGLFAVFVANKITAPLTLVQRSLAKTTIGKKNEPIFWKRNDEIGSLIKEYNNMIVALDNSANRIMRSERESAWREMAKQVAHEIKNPLTPLRLGVQLLERAWKDKDPGFDEKFERFCKSFIEQIESLNHIASEFSNFAKMPDTKLDDVPIIDIIEKSISVYSNNSNLLIKLDVFVKTDIIIHGDKDQLLRTFNNLIKNALEARLHHQKSTVIITVKYQEPGHVAITVQDFGKGIDEIVQEKIFQPNFTTKSSGTGLGLAFVKQTIESMGGTIEFATEKGKGTTFFILLPLKSRSLTKEQAPD